MSRENVEIVRRIYALLTQGDDSWLELVAPEFVVDFSRRLVDPFVLRGRDDPGFAVLQRELFEIWDEEPAWEPKELIYRENQVVAFIRFSGRGKSSGAQVEAHVANVWTFRDGMPTEFVYFGEDRAAALEAVGLSE
jgi:ketosteroid isomerase-like protein